MKRFFILLLLVATRYAHGGEVGNGGDGFASEFTNTAKLSIEILKKIDLSSIKQFDLDKFTGVVANTTVHTNETLFLNGQEVDAINYPKKKQIEVSRTRWKNLRESTKTTARFTLVIHEYLGIMKLDDSQYKLSNSIVKLMSVSNFSTEKWWNPANPTNYMGISWVGSGQSCSKNGITFDLEKKEEEFIYQACDGFTTVFVRKTSTWGGDSSGIMGTIHTFHVSVRDSMNKEIGSITYEPELGKCLVTNDPSCSQSGTFAIGNIHFGFSYHQ